jgi:hypothetical protein
MFICLIAQQAISQIEFVIRLKVKTGLLKNKDELEMNKRMKKRIAMIYILLGSIIATSVLVSIGFIVHENRLTVSNPTEQ